MAVEIKISKEKIPYKTAVNYLEKRVQEVKNGKKDDLLWILEHPLTFSAGVRSSNLDVLDKNIKLIRSKRGGKITLHNPGQKIIYFVIDLNKRKKDIRRFISFIEKSIIDFDDMYESVRDDETGEFITFKNTLKVIGNKDGFFNFYALFIKK